MKVKKGTLVISAKHTKDSTLIISCGKMKILSDKGIRMHTGHEVIITPPGIQRIGYAYTDLVATCIHRSDAKNIEEAINECVLGGSEILIDGSQNKQLEINRRSIDEAQHIIDSFNNRSSYLQ